MGPPGEICGGFSLLHRISAGRRGGITPAAACSFERRAALAQEPARPLEDVDNRGKRSGVQFSAGIVSFPVADHAIVRRDQALLADAGGDDLSRHRVTYRAKDFDDLIA
jgi:hypothetical protein